MIIKFLIAYDITSCYDLWKNGITEDGYYIVKPDGEHDLEVECKL